MSPQDPQVLPFRIGVAPTPKPAAPNKELRRADENGPERLVKCGSPVGKTLIDEVEVGMGQPALSRKPMQIGHGPRVQRTGPSFLVGANGRPIGETPEVDLVGVTGESLNSLTWPDFLAWRKTKCRPYSGEGIGFAVVPNSYATMDDLRKMDRALEEIDQATLEFIGEVAELGELFLANGPFAFFGRLREKLIDECGDIFFCGMWALDSWGKNPFSEADDLEMIRVTDEDNLAQLAQAIASSDPGILMGNPRFVAVAGNLITQAMMSMQTHAGLLANSFKKLKYQRREQDVDVQVGRVANTLLAVNQILVVANSSVEEALKSNQRKLDARYPEGYKPGQGGGIRTGEGA